ERIGGTLAAGQRRLAAVVELQMRQHALQVVAELVRGFGSSGGSGHWSGPQPIEMMPPPSVSIAVPCTWVIRPFTSVMTCPSILIIKPLTVMPVWSIFIEFMPTLSVIDCIASMLMEPRSHFTEMLPSLSSVL